MTEEYFVDILYLFAGYENSEQIEKTLSILLKILENIIKNENIKYRKISLTNNVINNNIVKIPGALYFLRNICKFDLEEENINIPKEISSLVKAGSSLNRIGSVVIEYGLDIKEGQYLIYKSNDIKILEFSLLWIRDQLKNKDWKKLNNIIEIILPNGKKYKVGFADYNKFYDIKQFVQRIYNNNIEIINNCNYNDNDTILKLQLNKQIIRIKKKDERIKKEEEKYKKYKEEEEKNEKELAIKIKIEAKKAIKKEIEKNRQDTIKQFHEDRIRKLKNKIL